MRVRPYPRRTTPGYSLLQTQRPRIPSPLKTSQPPCRIREDISCNPANSIQKRGYRTEKTRCPVPPELRRDSSEWIRYLEKNIPNRSSDKDHDVVGESFEKSEAEQCEDILELLYQARAQWNFDLLTILGFKFGRWQDFHTIINKLLDFADDIRPSSKLKDLPSNIDWKSLGSFDDFTGKEFDSINIGDIKYSKDGTPLSTIDGYTEEPLMVQRMGESGTRMGTMEEIWQSLGVFVLEAADLPVEKASSIMSHFYRVVARLHHINMVPHIVYKYFPRNDLSLPNRPPGMHLLSYPIMSVLSDSVWEADAADKAAKDANSGTSPLSASLRFKSRELGFGVWLEFILWCCVEGGFSREGTWILQESRNRRKSWNVQSWTELQNSVGPIDPDKMSQYDTWARCGKLSNVPRVDQSNRPFLGMGARTITREVVIAIMNGLINSLRVGVGLRGDSPPHVWERIGLLRSILNKNKYFLDQKDVMCLIVRILDAGSIVPEVKPQTLELLLNLAPYIPSVEELAESAKHPLEMSEQEYLPDYSGVVLGLYQYSLNIYAATGHISGTIDVFEKLLGVASREKVYEFREKILEHKYHIRPLSVRETWQSRDRFNDRPKIWKNKSSGLESHSVQLSLLSWSLVLDALTSSRLYSVANWLISWWGKDLESFTGYFYESNLLSPVLIRLAAATGNHPLFSTVTNRIVFPMGDRTLVSLLDYKISELDWNKTTELLYYLRDRKRTQWDVMNITSLAAVVVKLEHQFSKTGKHALDSHNNALQKESLDLAKQVLADILRGKFNERFNYSAGKQAAKAMLYQLHRLFSFVPGELSNVCREAELQWNEPYQPDHLIPSKAFNQLLTAIVDTQGCLSGKGLWDEFCITPRPVERQRIQSGGNTLLYFSHQLDRRVGGIEAFFDSRHHNQKMTKLVLPDLASIRIIAQVAIDEQKMFWQRGPGPQPPTTLSIASENSTAERIDETLDWCSRMFARFHLGRREIERELGGYLTRRSMSTLALTVVEPK